jgi:hypothetical protein
LVSDSRTEHAERNVHRCELNDWAIADVRKVFLIIMRALTSRDLVSRNPAAVADGEVRRIKKPASVGSGRVRDTV